MDFWWFSVHDFWTLQLSRCPSRFIRGLATQWSVARTGILQICWQIWIARPIGWSLLLTLAQCTIKINKMGQQFRRHPCHCCQSLHGIQAVWCTGEIQRLGGLSVGEGSEFARSVPEKVMRATCLPSGSINIKIHTLHTRVQGLQDAHWWC